MNNETCKDEKKKSICSFAIAILQEGVHFDYNTTEEALCFVCRGCSIAFDNFEDIYDHIFKVNLTLLSEEVAKTKEKEISKSKKEIKKFLESRKKSKKTETPGKFEPQKNHCCMSEYRKRPKYDCGLGYINEMNKKREEEEKKNIKDLEMCGKLPKIPKFTQKKKKESTDEDNEVRKMKEKMQKQCECQ